MKIMIWNAAKGGMRTVVETYINDGLIKKEKFKLIHSYTNGNFLLRQIIFIRALSLYYFLILTKNVELVHIHSAMRGSFWRKSCFMVLARLFSIPVVFHLHGSEMKPFYEKASANNKRRIQWVLERAERVVVLSNSWKEYIQSIAPDAKISIVRNYVPVTVIQKKSNKNKKIVFLGQIGKRKGVSDLIDAMASVTLKYPHAHLTIGGDGDRENAEIQVRKLGLTDYIEFAGWVGAAQRATLLKSADIFVLPSYNEGLPMSILEAMSYEAAVISTTVGGIPELITDGVNGRLVIPGDINGIAHALEELILDDKIRLKIAKNGRETQETFYSSKAVLPVLEGIYRELRK